MKCEGLVARLALWSVSHMLPNPPMPVYSSAVSLPCAPSHNKLLVASFVFILRDFWAACAYRSLERIASSQASLQLVLCTQSLQCACSLAVNACFALPAEIAEDGFLVLGGVEVVGVKVRALPNFVVRNQGRRSVHISCIGAL